MLDLSLITGDSDEQNQLWLLGPVKQYKIGLLSDVGWTPQLRTWVAVLDSSIVMCIYIYILYYIYPIITHLLVHLGSFPYICFISCGYSYLIHLPFICWSVSRKEQTTC